MKKPTKRFFYLAIAYLALCSCNKQPVAFFLLEKKEYIAGETIKLVNISADEEYIVWTLPDGTESTEDTVYYLIPASTGFATQGIKLKVFSKKGRHPDEMEESISIIPASWFSVENNHSINLLDIDTISDSNHWAITAIVNSQGVYNPDPSKGMYYLRIILFETGAPMSAKNYTLDSTSNITAGEAYIEIDKYWWEDNKEEFISIAGQVLVEIINSKIHVYFNQINVLHKINNVNLPNETFSGSIIIP